MRGHLLPTLQPAVNDEWKLFANVSVAHCSWISWMPGAVGVDQISGQGPFTIDMHKKKTYMMSPATSMEKIQAVHICISVIYNDHGVWIERYDTYNNDKLWINLIWSPPTWLNERHVKTMSIPKVQHLSLEGLKRNPMPSRPREILRKGDTKPRGQHTFRITKVFKFSLALLGLERLKNILARLRWHLLAGIMWASYS